MSPVSPIPEGYPRVTPYLAVDDAAKAIDFYTKVLGAEERVRMSGPDGSIGHAEIAFGDSIVMLADEFPDMGAIGPKTVGGTPVTIHLYVTDVDDTVARAVKAGAKELRPVEDQFYGDRMGWIEDPFGHHWSIGTHIEDVAPEEMEKRMAAAFAEQAGGG